MRIFFCGPGLALLLVALPAAAAPRTPKRAAARPQAVAPRLEKVALELPALKTDEELAKVSALLRGAPGVSTAIVDGRTGLAVVDYDSSRTGLEAILASCREAGFEAREYHVEDRFPKPIKLKTG